MSEIIEKTYKLIDVLENSEVIKNIVFYKEKLQKNKEVLSLINKINNEIDTQKKIDLRKELFNNIDYQKYMESYNELSLIVLKINKKYSEYTNTKEGSCNG